MPCQTHLGSSTLKTLVILGLPEGFLNTKSTGSNGDRSSVNSDSAKASTVIRTPRFGENNHNPKILTLPSEILIKILDLVALSASSHGDSCPCETICDLKAVRRLARVCRRFNRTAFPLLSYKLRIDIPSKNGTERLYRKLQQYPSAQQHCRALTLAIDERSSIEKKDYLHAIGMSSRLKNVRCLHIYGGFEGKQSKLTWAAISRLAEHMPKITHVSIGRHAWGLYLQPILDHVQFPSLRRLQVHGISETKTRVVQLKPERRRTAPITSISLSDYEESPQATAQLLTWPKALVHFHFESFYNNRFEIDLPMFHSWLLIHKDSLKTLSLGYLSRSLRGRLFYATDFPVLEVLRLSRWQMAEDLGSPATDAEAILAPNLRTFGWSFAIYDQHSEQWDDVGSKEENWLRGFVRTAVIKKSALTRIEVEFRPDAWDSWEHDDYPWDRLDRICAEFQSCGITVQYSTPSIPKEEWLKEKERRANGEENRVADDEEQAEEEESIASERSDLEVTYPKLDDPNPGTDIREYFLPVQVTKPKSVPLPIDGYRIGKSARADIVKRTRIEVLLCSPPGLQAHAMSGYLDAGSSRWTPRGPTSEEQVELEKVRDIMRLTAYLHR